MTQNPNRVPQTSQKMLAYNEKQHKKKMIRMQKKLKKQGVKLGLKDQEVVKMVAEVEHLKRGIHVNTIGIRNTKLKIMSQRRYVQEIVETIRMLHAKNMAIKEAVSGLGGLRKENEKQKKQMLELAYYCKNYEELVLLVREAEAMNEFLQRKVYIEASSPSQTRYIGNSPGVLPNTYPTTGTLGTPFKHKPLNPNASCFKSITPHKYPSYRLADDEKGMIIEQKCNPNIKQRPVKIKTNSFAAEMKRKFVEACREDQTLRSEVVVKVSLNVVQEKDNSIAVNVALSVLVTSASCSSDKSPPVDDNETESSNSSSQIAVPTLADVPDEDFAHHRQLPSFSSSSDHLQLGVFPKVDEDRALYKGDAMSISLKCVNDRKFDLARAKQGHCDTEGTQFLINALSARNEENIYQTFGFENSYPAAAIETELFFEDYLAAVE